MKYALIFLLAVHGLIHLIGFAQELKLASLPQFSGETIIKLSGTGRVLAGWLWLLCCILFLVATAGYVQGNAAWWMAGAAALVLSQVLVVIYWPVAKAGTVANVLVLLAVVAAAGQWSFGRMVNREALAVIRNVPQQAVVVQEADLQHLPPVVQKWLRSSGVVGKQMVYNARLQQQGRMRTAPGQDWIQVQAVQYFNTQQPAFVWQVETRMMRVVQVAGRDKYMDGKGNMLITAFGLIPFVDGKGQEIDQGSMLRYLAELCWMPQGVLSPYITCKEHDSLSATVTMDYKGLQATGVLLFDEAGRVTGFAAERYMGNGKEATLQQWRGTNTAWRTFAGVTVPVKGVVSWKLKDGDFDYYEWEITALEYNTDELYGKDAF